MARMSQSGRNAGEIATTRGAAELSEYARSNESGARPGAESDVIDATADWLQVVVADLQI